MQKCGQEWKLEKADDVILIWEAQNATNKDV